GIGRAAARDRLRRGLGAAPPARHLDRRRSPRQPDADALHDADHLSLSRPVSPVGAAALGGPPPVLARPRARTRRMTASNPSARRKPGPVVVRGSRASGMVRRRRRSGTDALSRRWIPTFAGMTIMAFAGACTIGPNYQRPATPVPVAYKEAALQQRCQLAHPPDTHQPPTPS